MPDVVWHANAIELFLIVEALVGIFYGYRAVRRWERSYRANQRVQASYEIIRIVVQNLWIFRTAGAVLALLLVAWLALAAANAQSPEPQRVISGITYGVAMIILQTVLVVGLIVYDHVREREMRELTARHMATIAKEGD